MLKSLVRTTLAGLLVAALGGCGGPATGDVSGTISFDGQPIQTGDVIFAPPKGERVSASIKDGKYSALGVPVGEAKILVTVPTPVGKTGGGPPAAAVGWEKKMPPKDSGAPVGFDPSKGNQASTIKLPAHYGDADATPLKYTVVSGRQTHNLELQK